jgi:hypothetical protein
VRAQTSRDWTLKIEEFARLLPAFESAYHALYSVNQTAESKTRQRQPGGGPKEPSAARAAARTGRH